MSITWKTSRGLFCSGWTPCSASGFQVESYDNHHTDSHVMMVIASYEDLRPGLTACCLLSIPPLIIFAPCVCPLLASTSIAYRWSIYKELKGDQFSCKVEEKRPWSYEDYFFHNVTSVGIISRQKAHTMSEYDGTTKSVSLTTQHIILHHRHGIYEFPEIPIDQKVHSFVNQIQTLLHQDTSHDSSVPVYPANCIVNDTVPLLIPVAIVSSENS